MAACASYSSDEDCDDTDPAVNPGATEICNGIDDNCDGQIDEGCAPEINLKQGATNIASAGSHDFGNVAFGSDSGAITFTIENTGSANLTLSGTPNKIVKSGTGAADFTVIETSTSTPVAASGTTSFTVTFTPSSAAAKTATISIANDDSDENPYTVTLNGTGTSTPTPGYGSTPAPGSTINVGTAAVGSPVSTTLAVNETGTAALNITSHSLGGTNPGDFSVTPATLSIADGGAAQNLTVQCIPGAAGLRTATLTVNHNASGSPATYPLSCTGTSGTTPPPVIPGPPLPIVITAEVSNITDSEALSGGEVIYPEGCTALLVGRGVAWDTVSPPTYPQDASTFDGWESGEYTSGLTNLLPQTKYYVRAYVMYKQNNVVYTRYSEYIYSFTTEALPGDVNGDKILDLKDAILALKVVAGIAGNTAINLFADVNGDGKIGMEEAVYVLQNVGIEG